MPPVFAHGRLRLYLLMLLDEAPRHGYEVIRLLEERFQGLYAPSAGTVYPRLAKLEAEGLVSHTTEGGRKVYSITEAGRAELADRQAELAELEVEIRDSVAALAADIREDVSGTASDLRREMREQARNAPGRTKAGRARPGTGTPPGTGEPPGWDDGWESGWDGVWGDKEAWRHAKEEMRRAKDEWKEQARKAKEEAQQARRQAKKEREAHTEALAEVRRIARQVQEQVQTRMRAGDWPGAVRDGMSELAREMGDLSRLTGQAPPGSSQARPQSAGPEPDRPADARTDHPSGTEPAAEAEVPFPDPTGDPVRDLERLLDRFRDDVRDAARDHGVSDTQLREVRRQLSTAAAHIGVVLRGPGGGAGPTAPGREGADGFGTGGS
ncbi:helix-turn-helix transcriptional regulator [Streptomyces smyrnaeus]|uniref:Helix-turn-helix transcriptional regulator n=1 Tax=Streptomyces smyrnaeus TaxID=1387713 RepID=A0ABS3XUM8_9ACTN|nr:helix-turn-helix transcriptional regulator [Streptomyces smyrnaeus]MBO8199095.1 helix-turn-helix transcriptional regulator [Streptomyces smyrnaeus]